MVSPKVAPNNFYQPMSFENDPSRKNLEDAGEEAPEREMSPPDDYGRLPQEGEPPHRFYEKGLEALSNFSQFTEYFEGPNRENIKALVAVLNHMLADDLTELLPEHGAPIERALRGSKPDYEDYQRALATIDEYLQENRRTH